MLYLIAKLSKLVLKNQLTKYNDNKVKYSFYTINKDGYYEWIINIVGGDNYIDYIGY